MTGDVAIRAKDAVANLTDEHPLKIEEVIEAASRVPGVRIDRDSYLVGALNVHITQEMAIEAVQTSPAEAGMPEDLIDKYTRLETEDFDGVEDLMAAILSMGIDLQRKRGFERGYSVVREDILGVRGRIDARSTARLAARNSSRVACEWDELNENTYKNRILKTVGGLLVASDLVDRKRRKALKRSLLALRDVDDLDPKRIEWGRLRYHRNNASYQLLMNVCYMVVESMLLTQDEGETKLAAFKDSQELFALYEAFVLAWFERHHPELRPSAKEVKRSVAGDDPGFLPRLYTDITLVGKDATLIIDCKCYGRILKTHHEREIASPANMNQIFSYVLHEEYASGRPVSGMLLYALTAREEDRQSHWNETGRDFYLWTLDLGQEFGAIADRLEEMAGLL